MAYCCTPQVPDERFSRSGAQVWKRALGLGRERGAARKEKSERFVPSSGTCFGTLEAGVSAEGWPPRTNPGRRKPNEDVQQPQRERQEAKRCDIIPSRCASPADRTLVPDEVEVLRAPRF